MSKQDYASHFSDYIVLRIMQQDTAISESLAFENRLHNHFNVLISQLKEAVMRLTDCVD